MYVGACIYVPKYRSQPKNRIHSDVALEMLDDPENEHFQAFYSSSRFDTFLVHVILYFKAYFDKMAEDEKPNAMNMCVYPRSPSLGKFAKTSCVYR